MSGWPGPAALAVSRLLTGNIVRLVVPGPAHVGYIADLLTRQDLPSRWLGDALGGDPRRLAVALRGLPAVFVVERRATSDPVGLVGCYDLDLENGNVWLGVVPDARRAEPELVLHGTLLATQYAFATWNLRKVYFKVAEGTALAPMDVVLRLAGVEGRLRQHLYHRGRFLDVAILAVSHPAWEALATPVLDAIQDLGD